MKTIVKVCKRAPGKKDLEHNYRGHATRSTAEREFNDSRVIYITGNSRCVGEIIKSPGFEKSMLAVISGPHSYRCGRSLRQLILSSEDMKDASEKEFKRALVALMRAAARWVKVYAPGCRFVAFAHADRHHPHVHLVVENWDYAKKRRLNLSPLLLEDMQKMNWAKGLGLVSGKGSLGRVAIGKKLAESGVDFDQLNFQQRVQMLAWNSFKGEKMAALALMEWCVKHNPPKTVDGITAMLESEPLPPGWSMKSKGKKGSSLRQPSILIDGRRLRIATFLDVWRDRIEHRKLPSKGEEHSMEL